MSDHSGNSGHGGRTLSAASAAPAAGAVGLRAEAEHQEDEEADGEEGHPANRHDGDVLVGHKHCCWSFDSQTITGYELEEKDVIARRCASFPRIVVMDEPIQDGHAAMECIDTSMEGENMRLL